MLLRIFMVAVMMIPLVSYGSTLTGELKGNNWRWISAVPSSGNSAHIVPSRWNITNSLPPATEVVLGGATDTNEKVVALSSGGASINLPVSVVGFEYNLGDLSSKFQDGEVQTGTLCDMYGSLSSFVGLAGSSSCVSQKSYKIPSELNSATPYAFVRPIIKFPNSASITSAFAGKPQGKYVGSVSVSSFYDYYIPGTSIRTRNYSVDVVNIEIDYESSFISRVTLFGNSEIPSLNDKDNTVSGYGKFKIDAEGWFSNGLNISLLPSRSVYEMQGPLFTKIPYSINCVGCAHHQLVESGSVINKNTSAPGSSTTNIKFDIDVSFTDVDLETLESGFYSDDFILFIEAGL